LVGQAPEGDILEVGTWRGGTALMLAASAQIHRPKAKVYVCDTFKGIALAGAKDNFHKDGDFGGDTSSQLVRDLLASQGLDNWSVHEGIFPRETGSELGNAEFGLVHVDVDVYQGHMEIFAWLEGRLVPGARIVFDDYASPTCQGATLAVHEYFDHNPNFKLVINANPAHHTWAEYNPKL
jgi:O-methyltransferase